MYRLVILILIFFHSFTLSQKANGESKSIGKVNNGKLINGRKFPYNGNNYQYFSPFSYYILNRAWTHSKIVDITLDTYKECEKKLPNHQFLLMECSKKNGGKMNPHRTHQNGTSIDFGTPLLKNGKPYKTHNNLGIYHYLMSFDEKGNSTTNKNVTIDFESMAQHILILDKIARKQNMYVKKVIFKINLKDDLFKTKSGKKLKRKKIYFARKLPKIIDNLHDDHYHVDFGFLQ